MIPRERLLNLIRSEDYSFKRQTSRIDIYKKKGSTHRVTIMRQHELSPEYVERILISIGVSHEEIRKFFES